MVRGGALEANLLAQLLEDQAAAEADGDVLPAMRGEVQSIGGRVGGAVDQVCFTMRNGEQRKYGGDGGTEQDAFELREGEGIVSNQDQVDDLLDELGF